MQIRKITSPQNHVIYLTLDNDPIARECAACRTVLPASQYQTLTNKRTLASRCIPCLTPYIEQMMHSRRKSTAQGILRERHIRLKNRTDYQVMRDRNRICPGGVAQCSECREYKKFKHFVKDRSQPRGLDYRCKACRRK